MHPLHSGVILFSYVVVILVMFRVLAPCGKLSSFCIFSYYVLIHLQLKQTYCCFLLEVYSHFTCCAEFIYDIEFQV